MKTRAELMAIREKIIKNSMLILIIQAVLSSKNFVTLGYSVKKLDKQTADILKSSNKQIPKYGNFAIIAFLSQEKIWLGTQFKDFDPIWQHVFPVKHFTIASIKAFINFAYACYHFNAAKTDKIFSAIPNDFCFLFAENNTNYLNYWKLGYTKKIKDMPIEYSQTAILNYEKVLDAKLRGYQNIAKILIRLSKGSTFSYVSQCYGELKAYFDSKTQQVVLTLDNYSEAKITSTTIHIDKFHPKTYPKDAPAIYEFAFYKQNTTKEHP